MKMVKIEVIQKMKKTITFISIMFLFAVVSAQTVSVTFMGRDANNQNVPLNRVVVNNITKGWQEILTWPDDTVLTMTDQTGVGNVEMQNCASLHLSQNTPNPFDGITFANLQVAEQGDVSLEITDISGRVVRTNNYSHLQPGIHEICITLSSSGIYFLTARQNGRISAVKMANRGIGSGNSIAFVGVVQPKNVVKDVIDNPFEAGDTMEYVGYSTINNNEVESEHIIQQQTLSETILLSFAETQYGLPCPNVSTVTDYDGNIYNTVLIGQQCWMKENLRTTHYHNGTAIAVGNDSPATDEVSYFISGNNDVTMYGYLYSKAAMNHSTNISDSASMVIQGVCPPGWHIPSDEEFVQLCGFVGSVPEFVCGSDAAKIAKALASTQGWFSNNNYCTPGNNQSLNNATGFTAYPAGFSSGRYSGRQAHLWTSTGREFVIDHEFSNTHLSSGYSNEGLSVRCIFGVGVSDIAVSTATVSGISGLSAFCGGSVSTGGETVIARGLCWSTSPEPTVSNDHTVSGNTEGSFTDSLTGLLPNTTYYVRAYVTINAGTAYGNQRSFITLTDPLNGLPCPGNPTVTDYDGNVYNTVHIGQQCWMKENLRTTHYSNGEEIPAGTDTSSTVAYRYNPNDWGDVVATYGHLYNWPAVMHGESPSDNVPSGVQGICPTGWHVPSNAEWTQLASYVRNQHDYYCSNWHNSGKPLASTTGWNTAPQINCAVGNNLSANNASGFSALPAGSWPLRYYWYDRNYGKEALFWTSTIHYSNNIYLRALRYEETDLSDSSTGYLRGFSVRCVCD